MATDARDLSAAVLGTVPLAHFHRRTVAAKAPVRNFLGAQLFKCDDDVGVLFRIVQLSGPVASFAALFVEGQALALHIRIVGARNEVLGFRGVALCASARTSEIVLFCGMKESERKRLLRFGLLLDEGTSGNDRSDS